MKLCSLALLLSLLALATAPAPVAASSAMYFTLQTDGQTSLVSGPCSSNGSIYSCSPGNVSFHDAYGTCTIYIAKSNDPFTGGTWSLTSFGCPYQTTGAASAKILHRTSAPTPTPTPFVVHTPPPTPTPTPAPAVLTATVEATLTYVSGPCTALPVNGGQLGGPPTYRCTASGTIAVKASSKITCAFAIVQPATTNGTWGVTKTGICTFALKGGNQLDLRPH